MKGCIVIILFRRPDYTKELLERLSKLPIEDYFVHFQIDPGFGSVIKLAQEFEHPHKSIEINFDILGCNANICQALTNGFKLHEFCIVLEDDVMPSPDFIDYTEWAKQFLNDEVRFIRYYNKNEGCKPDLFGVSEIEPAMAVWGWATTRRTFEQFKDFFAVITIPFVSWDSFLNEAYFKYYKTIMPVFSRTNNIGALNGTYTHSPEFHRVNTLLTHWAGSVEPRKYTYQLRIPY